PDRRGASRAERGGTAPRWATQPVCRATEGVASMRAEESKFSAAERNREHMERVRAVHRRSAYERVLSRIAFYCTWEREAAAGLRPPLPDDCRQHLASLLALRGELEAELVAHGQSVV